MRSRRYVVMEPLENRGAEMFLVAALLSFAVAVLHIAVIIVGASAYRYFGAGEALAQAAERGQVWPALSTAVITVVFVGFGLYALSGAGLLVSLPLLRPVLIGIAAIYTLHGMALVPQLFGLVEGPPRDLVFSAVSLAIGLVYIAGLWA